MMNDLEKQMSHNYPRCKCIDNEGEIKCLSEAFEGKRLYVEYCHYCNNPIGEPYWEDDEI